MTKTSKYNRVVVTLTLLILVVHAFSGHYEHGEILRALARHQEHSINALQQINSTLASSIEHRAEAQLQNEKDRATPKPTPEVIIKHSIRYKKQPTPKPWWSKF